jgi:hypothetical protein
MTTGPDPRRVDTTAAAVEEHAVDHHVEILFPSIDLIVTEQDLRETRAVGLHPRIAAIAIDRRRAAKHQALGAGVEYRGTDVAAAGINGDGAARNPGLEER